MALVVPINRSELNQLHIRINRPYVYVICTTVGLGGILFGFDMVIISGTVPFFSKHYALSEAGTGWAVGCVNVGAAFGALISGKISDVIGRRKLMLYCALLFAITGVGTGWAPDFTLFIAARMLSGVAVGAAALVCPMYIAEVAPAIIRGKLVTLYQLAIVTGLLSAYISNYVLLASGENNWRWMFSSLSVPAILFFSGVLFIPESPRWLVRKKRNRSAEALLTRIGGPEYALLEVTAIQKSFADDLGGKVKDLFRKDVRKIVAIGTLVAIFSQAVGENSIFSYAPVIFQQAGIVTEQAFLQSITIGVINFIFTFLAIYFIERIGRRKLLLYGTLVAAIDATALALSFYWHADGIVTLIFVLVFIAAYAAALGPVTWVLLSEIFPNRIRGNAMALATLSLWLANFFTIASFPVMKSNFGLAFTFGIHAFICAVYFLWTKRFIVETKGKSLEEIEIQLIQRSDPHHEDTLFLSALGG